MGKCRGEEQGPRLGLGTGRRKGASEGTGGSRDREGTVEG